MAAQLENAKSDKEAASKRTLQLVAVLAPAIAGVLGTFITVLPQLRDKDAAIGKLTEQLSQSRLQNSLVSDSQGKAAADAVRHLNITGTVLDSSGKPLGGAEVLLVPQNKPKHIGYTKADGSFKFPEMPDQRYRIVVRDAASGNVNVGDMDEDADYTDLKWATVRYSVGK